MPAAIALSAIKAPTKLAFSILVPFLLDITFSKEADDILDFQGRLIYSIHNLYTVYRHSLQILLESV